MKNKTALTAWKSKTQIYNHLENLKMAVFVNLKTVLGVNLTSVLQKNGKFKSCPSQNAKFKISL